jgi:hypothetical protein
VQSYQKLLRRRPKVMQFGISPVQARR